MHILTLSPSPSTSDNCVLAIGNFDGVHKGHQAVLTAARTIADREKLALTALTFHPHPRQYFQPGSAPLNLMSARLKLEMFRSFGIDRAVLQLFNETFAITTAQDFIHTLCTGRLGARHIVTGDNFIFGRGREGTPELLAREMHRAGRGYTRISAVDCPGGEPYSSTRIRTLLKSGDVEGAVKLLGHPYRIGGHVMHGDKRGRDLGFPTANLSMHRVFAPAYGIYAARVYTGETEHQAAISIGIRPHYPTAKPLLEAHLLDFSGALYGRRILVQPEHYLRPEEKFDSTQSLMDRMAEDVLEVRRYFETKH